MARIKPAAHAVLAVLVMAAVLSLVGASEGHTPGVAALYPPAEGDRVKPGTEIFLVCSRDSVPGQQTPMGVARLYEYRGGGI